MKQTGILIAVLVITMSVFAQTDSIALWPNGVPGLKPNSGVSEFWSNAKGDGIKRISKTTNPMIYPFIPENAGKKTPAVVICPGGGYGIIAVTHEGFNVARWFCERGIAAFVLKYRLPNNAAFEDKTIVPLQDAQQAIKYVREHAKQFNVNKNKIGIMGFSAGGHLAASATVHYKNPLVDAKPRHIRPAFSMLIYPVITFTDAYAHKGTRKNLLGPDFTEKQVAYYSNEKQVKNNTPTAFLLHAKNDKAVPWQNTDLYMKALDEKRINSKVVYLKEGGHGFGYKEGSKYNDWINHLEDWLKELGMIK